MKLSTIRIGKIFEQGALHETDPEGEITRLLGEYFDELLAKSGALVPVPDGEPCSAYHVRIGQIFTCEHDGVWQVFGTHYDKDWHMLICNLITGEESQILHSTIVQPVRLVPLEEFD